MFLVQCEQLKKNLLIYLIQYHCMEPRPRQSPRWEHAVSGNIPVVRPHHHCHNRYLPWQIQSPPHCRQPGSRSATANFGTAYPYPTNINSSWPPAASVASALSPIFKPAPICKPKIPPAVHCLSDPTWLCVRRSSSVPPRARALFYASRCVLILNLPLPRQQAAWPTATEAGAARIFLLPWDTEHTTNDSISIVHFSEIRNRRKSRFI